MTFTLNSIERVEIEEAFSKMLWLDKAIIELKYIISQEPDVNMKKMLEIAQARLHREMNDGWLHLCRVVKKYTEPPYVEIKNVNVNTSDVPTIDLYTAQYESGK